MTETDFDTGRADNPRRAAKLCCSVRSLELDRSIPKNSFNPVTRRTGGLRPLHIGSYFHAYL